MTEFIITHESTPVYDTWGWADYWSCEDWMFWFYALKTEYGKTEARAIFMNSWEYQGIWESNYNWCKYNSEFVEFSKKYDLDTGHFISNVVDPIKKVVRNLNWILPVTLILVGGFYVYKFKKLID